MGEYGNVIHQEFGGEAAQAKVIGNDLDPKKAQRAVELGEATGIDPEVVSQNLDEFDQYHKASLGAHIVRNNQALKQYIDLHPMAAAVSGDDLGQLDKITDKAKALAEEDDPLAKMHQIFWEGYGEGPMIGGWVLNNPNNFNEDGTLKHPYVTAIASGLGAFIEVPMRAFGGALAVGEASISGVYSDITGDESGGRRLARDFSGMVDTYMNAFAGRTPRAREFNNNIKEQIQKVALDQRAQMYWQSGKALPIGLSKEFDAAIDRVSKEYWKKIDDLASEADKSATKERNPEYFRTFIEQHPEFEGAYLRVDAVAVKRLYGEDIPSQNDGLLGFIPNLESTLKVGEDFGIPVRIPLVDWVTKVNKDLRDALKDDAHAKLQSVSKKEGEDLKTWNQVNSEKEMVDLYHGTTKGGFETLSKDFATDKYEQATFFSDKPNIASEYAEGEGGRIFRVQVPREDFYLVDKKGFEFFGRRGDPVQQALNYSVEQYKKGVYFKLGENNIYALHNTNNLKYYYANRSVEAIRSVRQSSGLEPTHEIFDNIKDERKYGAEKLKLARLDEAARKDLDINLGSKDAFDITDEKGNVVGTLQGQLNGTEYFVDWISSRGWAQSFGPKQVLQLIKELKAEYPELKTITGDRVSGARRDTEKQGERVIFKAQIADDGTIQISDMASAKRGPSTLKEGQANWKDVYRYGDKPEEVVRALVKPKQFWKENEKRISDIVESVIAKILPEGTYRVGGAQRIWNQGEGYGTYIPLKGEPSLILWALASGDRIHTAAHEAMHHLRQIGAIDKKEWKILEDAAIEGGWREKYNIDSRYPNESLEDKLEEAIAEQFGDVVSGKFTFEEGSALGKIVTKVMEILRELRSKLKEAFGRELTADDIFERARTGGMKRRSLQPERPEYTFEPKAQRPEQPELPGVTRIEDQQVFEKAAAMGLPVKQYKKLMQAIEDVREQDRKYQLEKAEAYERKKQTKEWKKEAEELEPKVQEELNALPDYRANEFFRTGVLDGEKLAKLPKLNPEFIDPELVRGLPEKYLSDKGMHPDDIAGLLGIDTGSSLVEMLANWKEAQGDVPAAKFVHDLVKGEVERRMSVKHGPLSENIIDAARDHIINNAQYELIHQDLLAAALRAGKTELPISKKEMEQYAKDEFRRAPVGNVSVEEILREMGKSARSAVLALLDGDPIASLKHMERRMMSFIAAREAKKLEVQQRIFDRNVKRFSEREVANFPQEYTNFIHDIMIKLGAGKLNFTFDDFQKRLASETHASLWDFTAYKMNHDLLEIKYDDRLFDDTLYGTKPPLDNLTVQQFLDAHDFMKSLIKNGRDEYKIERAGEIQEREAIKQAIIGQIETLDPLEFTDAKGGSRMFKVVPAELSSIIRTIGAVHWQLESVINRIDKGNAFGPFTQNVMRPLTDGANYARTLERKYADRLSALDDKAKLSEKVPNNLFIEPTTLELDPAQQRFMPMTRENLRKILLYWGSETGQKKLSEGYNLEPKKIQAWLDQHATKEDYEWAKQLGSIWRELKDEIDVMYQNVSGAPPEDIKLAKLKSPHGDYDGWYHPLVPHPNFEMTNVGGAPTYASGLVQQNFFRATTANGHIMRRTGAVYPLDLGLDSTASVMKRQIYDLAMRPGLIEASKFLRDRQIRTAITRHLGKEITDLIDPYLEDVANVSNNNDAAANLGLRIWNAFRSNVIGTMIGFNPGTVMKHGPTALVQSITEVGAKDFANATRNLWGINQRTGERNWNFAMNASEELQGRHRNYLETLKGQNAQVLGKTTWREKMLSIGAWPVAISDLASAVPTWLAQYNRSMSEGLAHGDAIYMADRAVRRAHGSTAVTNRPAVMRGGFGMSLLNPVYGFFSHILNRQYEMAWRASEAVGMAKTGEVGKALATMPWLAGMLTAYVIAPAIIEELVSPLPSKPEDSWGKRAGKTLAFGLSSSWIGIRDVAHFAVGGFNPAIGLTGPLTIGVRDIINDLSSPDKAFSEENLGKTFKHASVAAGMATGLTNAQLGRWGQLAYEYAIEKDVPQSFWQWLVALRFGQTKGHSKSPEEYVEHLTGEH